MLYRLIQHVFTVLIALISILHSTLVMSAPLKLIELQPGLKYGKVVTKLEQKVHLLDVDPKLISIISAHAMDNISAKETVANIAKRYHALAAINGGFFHGSNNAGLPAGILKSQNHWYSITPNARAAIGWTPLKGHTEIDRVQTRVDLTLNQQSFPVHSMNQFIKEEKNSRKNVKPKANFSKKAILFTDAFGSKADSIPGGLDIIIQNEQIVAIQSSNKSTIPKGGYVYVLGPKAVSNSQWLNLKRKGIHQPAKVDVKVNALFKKGRQKDWQTFENIVSGIPLLILNGQIQHKNLQDKWGAKFSTEGHARTSVGLLKNGHWIFAVVEQNGLFGSPGMTLKELASLLHSLGVHDALNLDGGGSSTLYINNQVKNHPEGDADGDLGLRVERKVSDAILLIATPK